MYLREIEISFVSGHARQAKASTKETIELARTAAKDRSRFDTDSPIPTSIVERSASTTVELYEYAYTWLAKYAFDAAGDV